MTQKPPYILLRTVCIKLGGKRRKGGEKERVRGRRKERKKEGKNRKKEELWFNVELKQVCFPYAESVKYLLD